MSHYECAVVSAFSARDKSMYATFFGGISQYWWDETTETLNRDPLNFSKTPPQDGLPFINTISTLRRRAGNSAQFLHRGDHFPPQPFLCDGIEITCLGSQTLFVPDPSAPSSHDVLLLDQITEPTPIGHLVGGIASTGPYQPQGTCASSKVYRVTLNPKAQTTTTRLKLPE